MALTLRFKPALGWKLILSVSSLIVLTSITLGGFAGQVAKDLIRRGLMDRGRSLARNLAYNSKYGLLIGNEEDLKQLVTGVIREEDVLYAVVEDDSGKILASDHSAQLREAPPRTVARTPLQGMSWNDPSTRAFELTWAHEIIYEIAYPIRFEQVPQRREEIGLTPQPPMDRRSASANERTVGYAAVGMSLSLKRVNAAIISILGSIAMLTGLVILAGIFVTVVLAKVIAGPVKELAEAARQIAEGDPRSHVRVKSGDEIGQLADTFNRMAESIQAREKELRARANDLNRLNEQLLNQQHELRDMNAQLESASRHKSQFLANMSHELRTPLNAILGFTGILSNKSIEISREERQEFLTNIKTSGRSLLGLINEVLDLSKIEAGRMDLNLQPFSLSKVLEDVRQTIEPLAAAKNIAIEVMIDPSLSTLTADEGKFKQILYNLLSNAIKFTPEMGCVHLRAHLTEAGAEFSVRDTGIGIRQEDQARIFQEFEKVEMSAERHYEGTGLGLTLAKKFVELLGGRIWVESELGTGSTFVFVLPLRSRRDPASAGMGDASREGPSNERSET